jgi:hydroxyacylglutathione hydrolase
MTVIASEDNIRIETMQLGPWGTNTYIVVCGQTGDSLVVDAPASANKIIASLKDTSPRYILLTHDHSDHTGALDKLRLLLKVPLAAHASDSRSLRTPPEIFLNDGDVMTLGKMEIQVLHTPGHTPGGLCFKIVNYLFAGDTIFPGGPGMTPSADSFRQIVDSITNKVFKLPDDTVICPGHGDVTTVKKAKEEYAVFASRPHSPNLCGDVLWLSS